MVIGNFKVRLSEHQVDRKDLRWGSAPSRLHILDMWFNSPPAESLEQTPLQSKVRADWTACFDESQQVGLNCFQKSMISMHDSEWSQCHCRQCTHSANFCSSVAFFGQKWDSQQSTMTEVVLVNYWMETLYEIVFSPIRCSAPISILQNEQSFLFSFSGD